MIIAGGTLSRCQKLDDLNFMSSLRGSQIEAADLVVLKIFDFTSTRHLVFTEKNFHGDFADCLLISGLNLRL